MENSYNRFLLQDFITIYYGTFLKNCIDSESRHQKILETPTFEKNLEKIEPNYHGYYGILRILRDITDITEIAITEYNGI
jgi:hypothetical protein